MKSLQRIRPTRVAGILRRLWYAERRHWVPSGEPIPVDWPPGYFQMVVTGRSAVTVSAWTSEGRIHGMMHAQKIRIEVGGELPCGAKAVHLGDISDDLKIESLKIDGASMLAPNKPIPLSVLQGTQWMSRYTPRWRVLLRGFRDAFVRAFTVTEEPK